MSAPDAGDDDYLDGCCDLDFDMAPTTADEDAAALVLFAGTQFDDPVAVEHKARQWRQLFGEGA